MASSPPRVVDEGSSKTVEKGLNEHARLEAQLEKVSDKNSSRSLPNTSINMDT